MFAALGDVDELNCMARAASASLRFPGASDDMLVVPASACVLMRGLARRAQVGLAREFCDEQGGAAADLSATVRAPSRLAPLAQPPAMVC